MTARDDLATTILHHPWLPDCEELYTGLCPECSGRKIHGGHNSPSHAIHLADAILAAGYRKPRTITTVAELDALRASAAILTAHGSVWVNDGDDEEPWASVVEDLHGGPVWVNSDCIELPATVIHEGAQS